MAGLKTSVEAFAANYTSGKDATKDADAVAALNTGLGNVAQSVFAETHVASKANVASLQQAVDAFAANYTSGVTVSKDAAAWSARWNPRSPPSPVA